MSGLTFRLLAQRNLERARRWHGRLEFWSVSDWAVAMAGEAGEACNAVKKLNRLRDGLRQKAESGLGMAEAEKRVGEEIADTVMYCDLLAQRLGLSLAELVRDKFNAVSEREGFPERL